MVDRLIPVRPEEDFNRDALARALTTHVPESGDGPLSVWQFPAGASNLTYLLRRGQWQGVLRRPPLGPVPPKAHDMVREFRWLSRLAPVFGLAPKPLWLDADGDVLGAPAYVMEYRPGLVLDREWPQGIEATPARGQAISEAFVRALVELHAVDWRRAGLGEFGHPEGFLTRQVDGWVQRYYRARTDELKAVDRVIGWLKERVPPSPPPTPIHNDFKLNNMVMDPAVPERIRAVVDWEMATIGDPLFDLGVALGYWIEPQDQPELRDVLPTVTTGPGFFSRREVVERYARLSGRNVDNLHFYLVLAYFKLAVILQQIYVRWKRGQTTDARFGGFGRRVRFLIEYAAELVETGHIE